MRGIALKLSAVLLTITFLSGCNLLNKTPDDKAIVSEVQAKLYQDPVLKTRNIQVVSEKGVVVLTGDVNTDLEKAAAERLAGGVSGVKQVINQLSTSSAPAATAAPPEPAMTAANNPPPSRPEPRTESRASRKKHSAAAAAPAQESAQAPDASSTQTQPSGASPAAPSQAAAAPAPPEPAAPPPPQQVEIPAGSVIDVRMIDPIDSERNHPGDEFAASLSSPVVVGDRVVIPAGSDARVRLIQSQTAGRMRGQSQLQIELVEVSLNGTPYTVQSGSYQAVGASRGKRTAETVGAGAVIGGLIGAIAGRGKGAAIGAGIGAASGAGVQAATKGEQVKIPAETKIEFTLKSPFTVTLPN